MNPILDAARAYLRAGYCPVPIPPREKGPTHKGWPAEAQQITPENAARYFKPDNNLGLLMGVTGLFDVDCDCPTAVTAARLLLPPTGFIYGHASAPRSHYIYTAAGEVPVNMRYVDPTDGETVVEFRGLARDGTCGLQTVVPPSVHRDTGEAIRLETDADGVPSVVDAVAVYDLVVKIAAAGLLAKHWPDGGRHAGELALAGALANAGMPEEDAVSFVRVAYQSVPTHDRYALNRVETAVRDTYHKHEAEAEHTGFKTLAESVGQDVATKAMAWLGLDAPQFTRGTRSNQAGAGLLSIVTGKIELFTAQDGRAYASYTRGDGIRDTAGLWTGEFQRHLTGLYFASEGQPIAQERVKEVVATLEYVAYQNAQRNVYLRVGASESGETIYYDIGNGSNIVEITADGWRVIAADTVDVRFRRPHGMAQNVLPANATDVRERFRALVNVENENDFVLLLAWLAGCFRPNGPYPILGVSSIQGSGKTTLTKMLRLIVDPNVSTLRPPPKDERDLAVSGNNNYMIVIDNVSFLPVWFADGLCRIATGTGFASRTLYANEDETVLQVCRPVVLNGIEDFATRGDVVDRLVPVSLRAISEEARRTEAEIWREFEALRPGLLAWVFDAVSAGLRNLPSVKLARAPRMADFAHFAVACESALGFEPGAFVSAYSDAKRTAESELLDNSLVAQAIIKIIRNGEAPTPWEERPQTLLDRLGNAMSDQEVRAHRWPKTARGLTGELKRITPALLASEEITVTFGNAARAGRVVSIVWSDRQPNAGVPVF
ncbi:MAG TPA: bifunctional DNA primase/polymerase [Bryobacteraceae bacterium]|nr:bifunctional DNA primase/polymerase [Bryobacteraceae bacterium]